VGLKGKKLKHEEQIFLSQLRDRIAP